MRLGLATALILLLVVPWLGVHSHPHWERVRWIPFISPPIRPIDLLLNVAHYVPWGWF